MPVRWFGKPGIISYNDCVVHSESAAQQKEQRRYCCVRYRERRAISETQEGAMNFRERFQSLIGQLVLKYSFEWDTG